MNLEIQEIQKRTGLRLEELTDKLNGLIGFISGQHKPPSKAPLHFAEATPRDRHFDLIEG